MEKRHIDFEDLEVFHHIVTAGSLSAAGRELGLSTAVMSRRLQKLEKSLGVRLLQRTTRRLTMTEVGAGYYERIGSVLAAAEEAEAFVRGRSFVVRGTLRISVPTSFGRLHIAPWLRGFLDKYPDLSLQVDLTDSYANVVADAFDLAIRISSMINSVLATKRLCTNNRVICASPEYLKTHGVPRTLDELKHHRVLSASNHLTWLLEGPDGRERFKTKSFIVTNSSDLVREGTLAGLGLALRSTWDVGHELKQGALQRILPQYRGSPDVGIYAVYPSARLVPPKVRAFVDYFANIYAPQPYWDKGLTI